jgi:hypothetical protein
MRNPFAVGIQIIHGLQVLHGPLSRCATGRSSWGVLELDKCVPLVGVTFTDVGEASNNRSGSSCQRDALAVGPKERTPAGRAEPARYARLWIYMDYDFGKQ